MFNFSVKTIKVSIINNDNNNNNDNNDNNNNNNGGGGVRNGIHNGLPPHSRPAFLRPRRWRCRCRRCCRCCW